MTADQQPAVKQVYGVRLEWGGSELPNPDSLNIDDTPTVLAMATYPSEVVIESETYIPVPALAIEFGESTGFMDEEITAIEVAMSVLPDEMTSAPFARVRVTIFDLTQGEGDDDLSVPFEGWLFATRRNVEGRAGVARLVCKTDKGLMEHKMCYPASNQCVWHVFGPGCHGMSNEDGNTATDVAAPEGPTVGSEISACTIESITGPVVVVSGLDEMIGRGDIWQWGYLEYRGLRIKIRDWSEADQISDGVGTVTTTFRLVRKPPLSWLGQVMRAVPGCLKTPESCDERYGNLNRFNGPGYAIGPYDPTTEVA